MKIFEYLACGKPVVTSDVKGAGDIVMTGNAGLAVNPETPEVLAEAVTKLLKDNELRESMGRNGRRLGAIWALTVVSAVTVAPVMSVWVP